MQTTTEPLSPEDFPENRKRIEKEIRSVLKDHKATFVGVDRYLIKELVDVVTAECVELRERIADRIVGQLIGRYENFSDERLELLAHIVKYHYEDQMDGGIELAYPPHADFTVKAGLRSI